jgi:hypothetical protein
MDKRKSESMKRDERKQVDKADAHSGKLADRAYKVGGYNPAISETPPKSQVGPLPTDDPDRRKRGSRQP